TKFGFRLWRNKKCRFRKPGWNHRFGGNWFFLMDRYRLGWDFHRLRFRVCGWFGFRLPRRRLLGRRRRRPRRATVLCQGFSRQENDVRRLLRRLGEFGFFGGGLSGSKRFRSGRIYIGCIFGVGQSTATIPAAARTAATITI